MNEGRIEEYEALPKAGSHRLIDFERAEVWGLHSDPPQEFVAVSGRKPYANMWVDLAPLMYVGRPGYWGIEVVGRLPLGIGLPSEGHSPATKRSITSPSRSAPASVRAAGLGVGEGASIARRDLSRVEQAT
jgi:hypothetical protein